MNFSKHKDNLQSLIKAFLFFIPFIALVSIHFILNINIPPSIIIISIVSALLAVLIINKDEKRALFLILGAFFTAEIVLIKYNIELGLALYSIFLAFLILVLIFRKFGSEIKEALFITGVIPLMRLLGALLPIESLSFLLRVVAVYSTIIIAAFITFKNVNFKKISSTKFMGFLPLAIILGIVLGGVEFMILRPSPVFEYLNIYTVLIGFGIMGLTGLAEEFIFRGLMQNHFLKIFNVVTAILLTNIIFMLMHLIWLNYFELIFVFVVGNLCGLIYYRTKNLVLVSFLHGMINFSLFILSPILIG